MKLKDLFQSTKVQKSSSLQEIAQEVESQEYIQSFLEDKTRFLPNVDYSDPANFAFFGSAEKYYTDAFNRIRNTYPYDGSEKEKYDWLNDSAFIDLYIFDQRYPRYNGHVKMSYPSWGTLSGSIIDGYGKSDTDTYIKTFGGPNKSSLSTLEKQFGDANVYDSDKSRESNLKFKLEDGVSIEMWIKKEAFNTSKTQKEVLFDLWNGQASSSAQYGRLRLELTGASSGSPFLITAMSGASGSQNYSIGQNVTTASIENWTHIAVTLKNSGSDILTNLYINGELNKQESITGAALGEVTGSLISYIGALQTAPSGSPTIQSGAGKFSGSLDEFRYWKAERTSKQIGRYYWTNVGGGTNTDDANTDLGVYYKFNEGITQTSSYDSVILDYSGRLSNGTWTGYSSGARSTDSAIVLANASPTEFKDPTIYSSHPSYVAVLAELEASGNVHDTQNNSAIFHTLPGWIIEDDDTKEGNLKNLTQVIGSYFDNTFLLIQELSSLKDIYSHFQTNTLDEHNNTSTTGSVKPLPFADRLLTNAGFVAPELFADATVLESLAARSEDENYELKLHDVKNQIYQNVYSSLTNTFKEKGTNKSFRNILHSFGIDEDVVKINFYGDNVDFEIKDRHNVRATKSKFVDFNGTDRFAASVYQYASGSDSVSFISGTSADFEKYIPVTFEVQTILGDKLPWDEPYGFQTGFTKSVIAGIHEADPSDGNDYTIPVSDNSNLQIYTVRDELESKRVRFHLSSSGLGIHLSSSLYDEMYENNDWLLAFRIRNEKYPTTDFVASSSLNSDYIVDFIGYNTLDSTEIHSFHVSASVGSSSAHSFLNTSKRIYVGAKRENFTGSLEERSDHKIGFVRYWMNYLSNDVLKRHSYDSTNYGVESPFRSAYLMEDSVNNIKVPEIDTLLLAWDFETLSTSDSNGEFTVLDVTSGSGEQRYSATFESLKRKFYHGKGEFFLANDEKAIDVNYINTARSTYPEILQGEDMVEINSTDDIKFTKNTLPQDYFIAFEKSMYQTISEEMIRFMSSVTDFNNLIGRPVDRYRMDYKDLSKLRQLFFERIGNEPDLDKYIDYYKWLDDALGQMLVELVPASLKHSDGINNVIENHVFSRDKYHNKFPTIEFKTPDLEGGMNTINRHLYPWKTGHAPVGGTPENENCYWWLERAERDAGILSSSDSGVNNTRTRVFQARNSVLNRSYTTPQRLDVSSNKHLHGGINYEPSKKRDYVWSATKEVAESPNFYGQMPMSYSYAGTPLRYILANNDMFQALKDCNDDTPVPTKIKRAFSAIDGFQVFHHYSSGGAPDGVYKGGMVMPFNIMSSSALKGYSEAIEGLPGGGEAINVVNVHSDTTDNTNEIPMQSPFTERWVGGHQHRHVALNTGIDAGGNRPEGYKILINNIENTSGSIGVAGADYPYPYASQYDPPFFRSDQAKARYYRDERAKRPLNVKNIQTTGSILGNYQKNYQFVHTFGRGIQKPILRDQADGFQLHNDTNKELPTTTQEASLVARGIGNGNLASNYNTSSLYLRDVKTSTANTAEFSGTTESIIASRFSAPGGFETMSEVFLDLYGKEKSAYNALPFRNLQVRGSGSGESGTIRLVDIHGNRYGLITHLTRHAAQFGIDSVLTGTNPAFHKTNRNPKWDTSEQSYDYDNYWIQHQIPQSDYQYQWVKLSHTASLSTSSLAGHILSEYTAPTGTTSYYPHESVNYAVPSQSVTNRRSTLSVYGYPSWEQVRNNDRNVNNQLKKQYGYTIATSSNVQAETDRLSLVGGIERDLRTVRTIEKKGNVTLEEPRVVANVPYTLEMNLEGTEFEFTYPYVNARYHFNNTEFYNQEVNPEFNETMYESFFGYYSSEDDEAFTVVRKNVKQIVYPQFIKHTKHSVRHRHFFASHYWTDGENDLYNTDINETGSYLRLDEVGRREVNVTASLFGTADLNSQTKRNVDQGYMTNVIPSQSIWSMDSRTNFTSSNPQTAASNSAGAPGVLQNQDHHFHNGLASVQVLVQSGSAATGSFELSGSTIFGSGSSGSFNVLGLPGQSGSYASGSFEVTGANIQGTSATGRFTVTGTYNPPTTSSFGFSVGSRTVLGTESSGSFTMTGSTVFGSTSSGSFQMTGSTVFGIASTGSFEVTGANVQGSFATGRFTATTAHIPAASSSFDFTAVSRTVLGTESSGSFQMTGSTVFGTASTGSFQMTGSTIFGAVATGSFDVTASFTSGTAGSGSFLVSDYASATPGDSITIDGQTITLTVGTPPEGSNEIQLNNVEPPDDSGFWAALEAKIEGLTNYSASYSPSPPNAYFALTSSVTGSQQNPGIIESGVTFSTVNNYSGSDAAGAVDGESITISGSTFTINLTGGLGTGSTTDFHNALSKSIKDSTDFDTITITDLSNGYHRFKLTASTETTAQNIAFTVSAPSVTTFVNLSGADGGVDAGGAVSGAILNLNGTTFTIVHDLTPGTRQINASGVTAQEMWGALTASIIANTVYDTITIDSGGLPAYFALTSSTTGTANNGIIGSSNDDPLEPTFTAFQNFAGGTNETGAASGSTLTIGSTTFTIVHDASPSALEINASGVTNQQMWDAMTASLIANTVYDTISVNSSSTPAIFAFTASVTGSSNNVAMSETGNTYSSLSAPAGGTDETGASDADTLVFFATASDDNHKYILTVDKDNSDTNGLDFSASVDGNGVTTIFVDSTRDSNSDWWNAISASLKAEGFDVVYTADSPSAGTASFTVTNYINGASGNNAPISTTGSSFATSDSDFTGGVDESGAQSGDTITIDGVTFTLTHTATSSVTEVQASGVSDSAFWESLRTKIESQTGFNASTGSDSPRTFQLTSSATGSSENPSISETGTSFVIQNSGISGTDESGAENGDSITIDGTTFTIDISSGIGTGSTTNFHNALSKSIKDSTDFDTVVISDLGNGFHRFSLTSSVTGTAKNVSFTQNTNGARTTFQNLAGASGGTNESGASPGSTLTIGSTTFTIVHSASPSSTQINASGVTSQQMWNAMTAAIISETVFDTISVNSSSNPAIFSITSSTTGTANNVAMSETGDTFSSLSSPAGGTNESGASSGSTLTIGSTTFTIVHDASPSALEINASGVTNQQMWNAMSAAIISNTDFDTISVNSASNPAVFSITSSTTGTANNVAMTEAGDVFVVTQAPTGGTDETGVVDGDSITWFAQPADNAYKYILVIDSDDSNTNGQNYSSSVDASGTTTIYVDSTRNGNSEFWNAMSSAISASGFTVSKTNDSPAVGSASFEITNSVGGATGNNGAITISGNSFSSSYSNLIGGADSTGAESGDTVTIDGITFTLTHTATSSVTEVQASGVSDSVFWESLRTKIESNTGYTATTGSDDPRTFQLTSSATGSSENPNISETGTAFTIQSAGTDGTDESGAEDADSITIDGVAFDIDIASGLGTGSTSQFHNALSKSIKDNTDFDTITISDLGNGYHRFSLTSSVTGTAKNVAFTNTLGGARSTFQNLTGASGGTTAPAGVIGGDYLVLDPGASGTINDTRHIRIGPPFYPIGDATTRIDVNTSSISAGNDLARSTEFWNLLTQSIKNSSSFDTVSLNVLSAYNATISITSSVTGTYFNGAFDNWTSGFSPIGNTVGGTLEAGAKSGDSITISGTTITITHSASPSATEVNASGVTNQQFWNDLSAAIIANTDFDTISISTSSFQATFNLTSSVTGTSHNVTLTTSSDNRTFSGVEGLSGGSEPVYQSVKFTEVIPQPRYFYPHTLTSPGSLRSPSEKSNLGLINTDYKLRSNHFNITRSLGHVTDGLFDNTARWDTPDLSGLTPFDSDYNAWYENVGAHNKHYSLVPEFRISSHVENILNSGADEFDYFKTNYWLELTGTSFDNGETISTNASPNQNQFLGEYSVTTNIKNIDKIVDDNSTVEVHPVQITLTCDSILKFLPYEGFYPQTRTVQMCQAFANSYGKHFTAVESDSSNTDLEFPDNNVLAQSRPIYDAIMSPGILYNTIKSGIAVDYPILTNKMLTASIQDPYGGINYMIKNEYFNDRLPFETLITPETYLTKKGIVDTNPHPSSSFNLKTSWTGEGDLNYKLMANNFFAETIEFFLEGGKTSRIISKPDTDPTFGIVAENELGELPVYRAMFRVYKSKKQHPYLEFTGSKDIISSSTTAFDRYHDRPPSGTNYFLKDYAGLTGSNLEYDINKVSFPRPQLNPYSEVGSITMYSQPNAFGPPCAGGVATEFAGLSGGTVLTGDNNNTTYMMYDSTNGYNSPFTPPYYDGESWAIYTFKPKRSGKHTLDEILESTTVKYLRYELNHESGSYGDRGTFGPQGFSINDNAMQANASFNLFKQVSTVPATFDNVGGVSTVDSDPNKQGKAWVIESKFETPILDFSKYLNREYNATFEAGVTAADIYTGSLSLSGTRYESGTLGEVHPSLASVHYLSGILNPVGMWHQYGEFPEQDDKGIFMQIMDIPTDYTELGTELTIANPKYATVKPIEQTCDSSGLQEVYNTSSQTSIVPYFKKQEIRRRLAGSSEFSVDGGAIQVINAADGTIIDTELKESDLESAFGPLPAAGTGSTIGTFTVFEIFRNYDVSELTGANFASGYYNVYSSGSSVSESYSKTTGGNYPGHWQASYYHYDRPTTYKPILIKTKNFESLKYDFNDFKRGFYEEFLKDFSIGMHYAKQATDFSDNPDIKCAQAPQNTVFVPSNIKDIVDANNNNLTITSLSELDSSDKARSELLGIQKQEDTVAKSTFKAVSMATTLPYKFKLIPPNPAVATSPNTSSYDYSEPMFVRGSIKFNQGAPTASSDIASRGLSHFASMSQHAPQSDANIGTNPSTVRWGQFMHNQQSPQEVKSLADLVGFSQEKIKMGVTAKTRMIKEAIIAIPYIEEEGVRNFLNLNKTAVNDYLFAKGIILKDRNQSNPSNIQGEFGAQPRQALDAAVESQIQKMQDYSLPPHLDFIENDIDPVAMYIFEFTKELSRNELNDLWQGVRSETLKNVSFDQKTITHSLISDSLLSSLSSDATGNRYVDSDKIKNLKWMVFKVKQKANKDYFEKMEKDLKDNRFSFDQENSKQEKLKYGYNWPYDYFSLVENAKMTVDVEFLKIPKAQVIEAGDLGNQSETLNDAIITSDYGGLIGDLSADPISETQTEAVQQESKTEENYPGPVLNFD